MPIISSNENMTLKLHKMTHFDMIFFCYSILSLVTHIENFSTLQGGHGVYGQGKLMNANIHMAGIGQACGQDAGY